MSRDLHQTADGRCMLDEAKEKRERPSSAVSDPRKYGPNKCSVCAGFCCGEGPVRPSYGKGAAREGCSKKHPATRDNRASSAQVMRVTLLAGSLPFLVLELLYCS